MLTSLVFLLLLVEYMLYDCKNIVDGMPELFRTQNLIILSVFNYKTVKIMLDLDLTPPETVTLSCNMTGQCNYTLFDVVFGLDQSGFTPPG